MSIVTRFTYAGQYRVVISVLAAALSACPRFALGQGTVVEIPDAGLRAAIEEALGKESGNEITEEEMASLASLTASGRAVAELTGLQFATGLETLDLANNQVADLSPVSELAALTKLVLKENLIEDLAPLANLESLTELDLWGNRVVDVLPLADLEALTRLVLRSNRLADLAPLSHLTNLEHLNLAYCGIADVSDLSGLTSLRWLGLLSNRVVDLEGLAELNALQLLDVRRNQISDLTPLGGLTGLRQLWLSRNDIEDLTALSSLTGLSRVDLASNQIGDIAALVDNVGLAAGDFIDLRNNPLNDVAMTSHVPTLENRGVEVSVSFVLAEIPDPGLRSAVEVALNEQPGGVITATELASLTSLDASGAGVADLTGLEHAVNLVDLWIHDNQIEDISPLTANEGLGSGDVVYAWRNAWGSASTTNLIPALRERGATVVVAGHEAPLIPAAADEQSEGFVRIVNKSEHSGEVWVHAIDDTGRVGTTSLPLESGRAVHFNSGDLEGGNDGKGIVGVGQGEGSWRLELYSSLDVEVSGHLRTRDGFLTAMGSIAPWTGEGYLVATFNPGRNSRQASSLRLANPGSETAEVVIEGIDDAGQESGTVRLSVAPGTARTLGAAQLESGEGVDGSLGEGTGKWRLMIGSEPHLEVMSLLASPTGHLTNLSTAPSSEIPSGDGRKRHRVFLFPAAAETREGFARVVNRGRDEASIRIDAYDDEGNVHGPATLVVNAGQTAHFNSRDLELGNVDKGLSEGVGQGTGSWRLELTGGDDMAVLSYIRTPDGFLTSMHDKARGGYQDGAYRYGVAIFNPGSNRNQESRLRLVNEGNRPARVTITGKDDAGRLGAGGGNVMFSVPAFAARSISAGQLESGEDLAGALGDGQGKWRISVTSDRPLTVLNLLGSPTGHLTNLSSAGRPSPVSVAVATPPAPGRGQHGRAAVGTVAWRVVSAARDLGGEGVAWSITANHEHVSIESVEGTAAIGEEVVSSLAADCLAPGRFVVNLSLAVGGESGERIDVPWSVTCRSENGVDLVVEQYQGPMGRSWNSVSRDFVDHVPAMYGRHTVLAGRVLHGGGIAPDVSLSIRDADGVEVRGEFEDLLAPVTRSSEETASGLWETEYTFDVPGDLFQGGNEANFAIATGGEDVEYGIAMSGWASPAFRISLVPIHSPTGEPSEIEVAEYMDTIHELLPIEDDHEAVVGDVLEYEGDVWDRRGAARQLLHRWNTDAEPDEFYFGIFRYPFDGSPCGFAWLSVNVAVGASLDGGCPRNIYPHELGHNLSLRHPPDGCVAANTDPDYPYERAGIGPRRGWLSSLGAFVNPEDGYFDTMSYCDPNFISDYHYRKAFEYRRRLADEIDDAPETLAVVVTNETVPRAEVRPGAEGATADILTVQRSLALTGSVDEYGTWSLDWVEHSEKVPRHASTGRYRLLLLDGTRQELHTESLRILPASEGGGAAWAARTPAFRNRVQYVVVEDGAGNVVLEEAPTKKGSYVH